MPLVSCIMATKNRSLFLQQAFHYYRRQTFLDSELILVDDSADSCEHLLPDDPRVRYVRLTADTPLGEKLNIAIQHSSGAIIQKLDDDDYYHPQFLQTTVSTLLRPGHPDVLVAMGSFLVLIVGHPQLYFAGEGWFAGGTLCFFREAWDTKPFRNIPHREDVTFLEDHRNLHKISIANQELYVLVRHGNHTWNIINSDVDSPVSPSKVGMNATLYFSQCPAYDRSITELLPPDEARFYHELANGCALRLTAEP
jgi:glycosyltransferase involved in cell wall biosynthesis